MVTPPRSRLGASPRRTGCAARGARDDHIRDRGGEQTSALEGRPELRGRGRPARRSGRQRWRDRVQSRWGTEERSMSANQVELDVTLTPDGTVVLDARPNV